MRVPNRLILTGEVAPSDTFPLRQHAWRPNGRLSPESFQLSDHRMTSEAHARLVTVMENHCHNLRMPHGLEKSVASAPQGGDFYHNLFRSVLGFDPSNVYGVFHGRAVHGLGKCYCKRWLTMPNGERLCSAQLIEELLGEYIVCVLGQQFRTWRFAEAPQPGFVPKLWGKGELDLLPLAS